MARHLMGAQGTADDAIIVTGAGGFIGQHVVWRLIGAGARVLAISRRGVGAALGARVHEVCLDLEDAACLSTLQRLGADRIAAVVHCAASIPASMSSVNDPALSRANRAIDDHVLTLCEQFALPLVYSSSAGLYPRDTTAWQSEEDPVVVQGGYFAEKLVTETEALRRLRVVGAPFASLRISAPYGAGQSTTTVVTSFVERALRDAPLQYFGTGTREQDFIRASDVAEAAYCAIRRPVTGIFNVASGIPTSARELADIVVRAVPGCRSRVVGSGAPDPQEGLYARFSIAKAEAHLDWRPRATLSEGIRQLAAGLATGTPRGW